MRLRTLELVRYGGYADRALDFGEGDCDLHLVVGPNEAGKSTLLSAIGDLLFGFPGQTTQDWRFGYQELRIRAELEHESGRLSVIRRKGNKNTLLGADGAALPDDTLTSLLGGLDRPGFERMFGLDRAKLQAGGHAMLEGRDDASRTLFEAGTGLAAAGAELRRLDGQAAALFKPGGSNPTINQLLRERQDALKRIRDATLGDAQLTEIRTKESEAERRRAALIEEANAITSRLAALERLARSRAPLQRFSAASEQLTMLGVIPDMPADAQRRLGDARVRRSAGREALAAGQEEQEEAQALIDAAPIPEQLLAERPRIESLEERRPAVEKAENDLLRRRPELEESELRLTQSLEAAGLHPDAAIPPAGWRRRLGEHLEAHRALVRRAEKLAEERTDLNHDRTELDREGPAPQTRDPREIRESVGGFPNDAEDRLRKARRDSEEKSKRADQSVGALGWSAGVEELATLFLPSPEETSQLLADMETAKRSLESARDRLGRADSEIAVQRRRLTELTSGGELPTQDAMAAARGERGEALGEVVKRLSSARDPGDAAAGIRLTESIGRADVLADRRESEASRVAEHALARIAEEEAKVEAAAARQLIEEYLDQITQLDAAWTSRAKAAGLPALLTPVGLEAWRGARERALQDAALAEAARTDLRQLQTTIDEVHARLGHVLASAGFTASDSYAARLRDGRLALEHIEAATQAATAIRTKEEGLRRRALALERESDAIRRTRSELDAERLRLTTDTGLARSDYDALGPAFHELESAAQEDIRRGGFARQVDAMEQDVRTFTEDVERMLADLGRASSGRATQIVRALALDLRAGMERKRDVQAAVERLARANSAVTTATRTVGASEEEVDALIRQAGVPTEAELEPVIAAAERAADLKKRRDQAIAELQEAGEGRSLEELARQGEELPSEVAAAERESLLSRRAELEGEREGVGRDLAQARLAMEQAAASAEASEAQQAVADTQGALRGAAELHIEASAQAALLRWVIERYRAATQAPLLARAGGLFAIATRDAFAGLALDYNENDQAQIVAMRDDGSRVAASGLSEGTRDQLYLSLRLGSVLNATSSSRPPMVCDDLLSSSDDGRAAALLRTLRDASELLQILVFTHHEHLIDVATKALGASSFRLHRLSPVSVAV